MKQCTRCREFKPETEFSKNKTLTGGWNAWCKTCMTVYRKINRKHLSEMEICRLHQVGKCKPMGENRNCALFLGVHVAERLLSLIFENVDKMPFGNKYYDFTCAKGYKIDVKSSCRRKHNHGSDNWVFHIRKNTVADYFLCIAFDDREHLTPEHLWLIPGNVVNNKIGHSISESALSKWSKYEQPLDKVINCCNVLKTDTT